MVVIPKHIHFIFGLAPKQAEAPESDHRYARIHDWSLVHHVCVRSAIEKIKPGKVSFYFQNEPSGPWWDLTKPLVDLRPVVAPDEIFGRPLVHYAHKADVIRLEQLYKEGGIYLDVDAFVHRDFDDLLGHSTVLGQEGEGSGALGLCNAIMLAEKEAPFIQRWYESYRDFDGSRWSEHSVERPLRLAQEHPDEVTVLGPRAFFWPLWSHEHLYWMYGSPRDRGAKGEYANHLWESLAWEYLNGLGVRHVRQVESEFHRWARPYLEGLPDDYGGGWSTRHGIRRDLYARGKSIYRWRKSQFEKFHNIMRGRRGQVNSND